jgi:OFA family oxalate/formate antiporter-like MFS transporter
MFRENPTDEIEVSLSSKAASGVAGGDLARQKYGSFVGNRWVQLLAGFIAMVVISNYQYAFTLFSPGLLITFPTASAADILLIYTIFVLLETWPVPFSGFLIDRFGIRKLMSVGAVLILAGWVLSSFSTALWELYLFYGVFAGVGAGTIYISCVGNAVKWFPDHRGFAAGLTAAGFGGGAALTIIPISLTIAGVGWQGSFLYWGIAQGVIAFVMAIILIHPPAGYSPKGWEMKESLVRAVVSMSKVTYNWRQALRKPEFWLLYIMFCLTATGGMMATGNLTFIAKPFGVANVLFFGLTLIALSGTANGFMNGLSRPLWGWVSDRFGRENTMATVFLLEAFLVFLVCTTLAGNPVAFVLLLSVAFLAWGEIYALYSAVVGDIFGPRYATTNYGMLYTGKGVATIFAGYGAALLATFAGTYLPVLYITIVFDIIAALLAIFVLKGMVQRRLRKEELIAIGVPSREEAKAK